MLFNSIFIASVYLPFTGSVAIVVAAADAGYELTYGTRGEIEAGSGLVDNDGGQFYDCLVRMQGAQEQISTENLGEHLTFVVGHPGEGAACLHGGNDDSGTLFTDPESGGGGLGDLPAYVGHADYGGRGNFLPENAHDVGIASQGKVYSGSEVFHNVALHKNNQNESQRIKAGSEERSLFLQQTRNESIYFQTYG